MPSTSLWGDIYGFTIPRPFLARVTNPTLFSLCVQPKVDFYGWSENVSPTEVSNARAGSTIAWAEMAWGQGCLRGNLSVTPNTEGWVQKRHSDQRSTSKAEVSGNYRKIIMI